MRKCSNILDVSMGEAANGWSRLTAEDLGEGVLGCLCYCYKLVFVQQTETKSSRSKGTPCAVYYWPVSKCLQCCMLFGRKRDSM